MSSYDPDEAIKKLGEVTPEEFGIRICRVLNEHRPSTAWWLIGEAFKHIDEFGLDWENGILPLIERIAEIKLLGEE